MTTFKEIETKHHYTFPKFYKELWEGDMLNWMRGFDTNLEKGKTWSADVYPTLKENPPVLLHSGGSDFELLTPDETLHFEFPDDWDTDTHHFIPFAKTAEGNVYAFYENIEIEGENPIVLIWDDDETEIIAKNFEDFIFRKMVEAVYDVDKDDLDADYKSSGFEGYRIDIQNDLKSISPYIKNEYRLLLEELYSRKEVSESMISFSLLSREEMIELIHKHLAFDELNTLFEHEID